MSITLGTGPEYVFQNPQLKFLCGAHFQINASKPEQSSNPDMKRIFLVLAVLIFAIKKKPKGSESMSNKQPISVNNSTLPTASN